MQAVRTFKTSQSLGNCGKELVKQLFRDSGYIVLKSYAPPEAFIDFIAYENRQALNVFVRTDTRIGITGNVVVERFTHRDNGPEIGWLFRGQADVLCYLDAINGNVYAFDWAALRKYVVDNCRARPFRNTYDNATGDSYIVPLRLLKQCEDVFLCEAKVDVDALAEYDFERPAPF